MLIDTHAAVRDLEAAGLETPQAEAIVRTFAKADATLATKADIATLKVELETHVHRLHERIDSLRSEMRWMLGFVAALVLAIAGRLFGVL